MRNRLMARQEAVNSRLKSFKILFDRYRHDIEDHNEVFRAILVITQIAIENGEPLYSCADYAD